MPRMGDDAPFPAEGDKMGSPRGRDRLHAHQDLVWTVARGPRPDGSVLVARPQGGTVEALVSRGHETAEQADAAEQRCS